MTTTRTTILLAEDHKVVREGLKALLSAQPGLEVVGEAADGIEALELVERLAPDVIVLDLMLPGLGGLEVTRQVTARFPKTKVVILTMQRDDAYAAAAVRNGASAFLVKATGLDALVEAVREVAAGRRHLDPALLERLAPYDRDLKGAIPDPYDMLTTREREVLQLAAEGHTNAEIAARLFISPRTVEDHRAHLMRKLHLTSRSALTRYAIRRGILPSEG